jgi:hypothetical protein
VPFQDRMVSKRVLHWNLTLYSTSFLSSGGLKINFMCEDP